MGFLKNTPEEISYCYTMSTNLSRRCTRCCVRYGHPALPGRSGIGLKRPAASSPIIAFDLGLVCRVLRFPLH